MHRGLTWKHYKKGGNPRRVKKGVCMAEEKRHRMRITYEIDGEVIKVIEREISEKYKWFMIGNSIWREY